MRHNKKVNHLGRKSEHRKALLANLASSLILHKRIETTTAKAKALRVYIEPLITKSKTDSTHSRRIVFSYLKNKYAVSELFREVAPKVGDRPGGYVRVLKIGFRQGDAAEMAMIEFVDFNEAALAATTKKETKKTTRRSRRSTAEKKETKAENKETSETTEKPEKKPRAPRAKKETAEKTETAEKKEKKTTKKTETPDKSEE